MGFTNFMREEEPRTLENNSLKGVVVNSDDPLKLNRVQIRSHVLHKNVADEDLPWFTPSTQNSSNSSGNNQGTHGPIPPKGTEIYFNFQDDSQYHGQYTGAPIHDKTRVTEFAKPDKSPDPAGGADNPRPADKPEDNTPPSEYAQDYPHVAGSVDPSGNIDAVNHKRDIKEHTHVSGTQHSIDGKGNSKEIVNGGWKNPNKDAKAKHPDGKSIHVTGDCVIHVSGKVSIHGGGDIEVISGGEVKVMAAKSLFLSAGVKIALHAPSITSSVEIIVAAGKPPESPKAPEKGTPRKRPELKAPENDKGY